MRAPRVATILRVLGLCALAATAPLGAQTRKPPRAAAPEAAAHRLAPPDVQVTVDSLLDRRSTSDFPSPSLSVTLGLTGADAPAVRSVRSKVTRAVDDTGRDLTDNKGRVVLGTDGWQAAREDAPPKPRLELASPSRKAKALAALEGVIETYSPSRDPAATVKIDRVLSKKDRPLAVPTLAAQHVRLTILSKAGLEEEKKRAEAKKKAEAAKKKASQGKKDGIEEMAEAMAGALVGTIESLFSTVGEHDVIVKVEDPGKKVFSFDLATADGKPIPSYATTDLESYRIVRMLEPVPESASLQVRLKTAKSFGEVPFALADVKLP
jgi:uncharacterized protein with GYD domain